MAVQGVQGRVVVHQRPCPEVKLKERELHLPNFGKDTLPKPKEGTLPPVEKNSEEYKTGLKATQTEVGPLQW
eukprot:12935511-Prorocentrum_lima.AAC.1